MSAEPTISPDRTTIAVRKSQRADLTRLRKELGFRTNGALLVYLCLEASRGGLIPPASFDLVFERLGTQPVILTGSSGSVAPLEVKERIRTLALDIEARKGDEISSGDDAQIYLALKSLHETLKKDEIALLVLRDKRVRKHLRPATPVTITVTRSIPKSVTTAIVISSPS